MFVTSNVVTYVPTEIETSKSLPPPPSQANLGHLTTFCSRGVGNLTFLLAGWGKLNQKCKVSNDFFLSLKWLTAINMYLDEMEEFKGRDIAIS